MFGMGMTEILVIMALILVVLGPEKIPDVARLIGKTMKEVRKASNLLRDAVMIEDLPKPRKQAQPTFDQEFEDPELAVEETKSEIQIVTMTERVKSTRVKEILLTAVLIPAVRPTEVYLHIPYSESF